MTLGQGVSVGAVWTLYETARQLGIVAALGGSTGSGWCLRLRRVALRQGGDDLGRFHADADDLSDEADDVLRVVGVVGVRADAGAFVFLDAVLIDDPLDGAAVAEAVFEDLRRDAR